MFRENFEQFRCRGAAGRGGKRLRPVWQCERQRGGKRQKRRLGVPPPAPLHLPSLPPPEIIRDPLWDNIRVDPPALLALDTPPVQRLRYIRQVGGPYVPGLSRRHPHPLRARPRRLPSHPRALALLEDLGEPVLPPKKTAWRSGWRRCCTISATIRSPTRWKRPDFLARGVGAAKLREGELGERLMRMGGRNFPSAVGELISGAQPEPAAGTHLRLDRPGQG